MEEEVTPVVTICHNYACPARSKAAESVARSKAAESAARVLSHAHLAAHGIPQAFSARHSQLDMLTESQSTAHIYSCA